MLFRSPLPPNTVLVDNGVMIAWLGRIMHDAGYKTDYDKLDYYPYQRTDDIDVFWR